MEHYLKHQITVNETKEPEDKYGVHFNYQDLCQRLLVVKRQRERITNPSLFKSFDKVKKSPTSVSKSRHKSKSSIRSASLVKNQKRRISPDFLKLAKVYSPKLKPKIQSPDRFLSSIRFPKSVISGDILKRRISRSRIKKIA
jgi:hypothetical protein